MNPSSCLPAVTALRLPASFFPVLRPCFWADRECDPNFGPNPSFGEGATLAFLDSESFDNTFLGDTGRTCARQLGYGGCKDPAAPDEFSFAGDIAPKANPNAPSDVGDNHIGLDVNRDMNSIITASPSVDMNDGTFYPVHVGVDDGIFTVQFNCKTLLHDVSIPGFESFVPMLAFTATNGGNVQEHQVRNVAVTVQPPPNSQYRVGFGDQFNSDTYNVMVDTNIGEHGLDQTATASPVRPMTFS